MSHMVDMTEEEEREASRFAFCFVAFFLLYGIVSFVWERVTK